MAMIRGRFQNIDSGTQKRKSTLEWYCNTRGGDEKEWSGAERSGGGRRDER